MMGCIYAADNVKKALIKHFSLDSKLRNALVIFNDHTYVLKARFQLLM